MSTTFPSTVDAELAHRPPDMLVFTDAAAGKGGELIREEANPKLKLRVFVSGGGCSGFQYGFTFDEVANEDDTAMEKDGVTLLIDPMSYQYLVGAEIDYQEGLEGAQFVIKNPNATSTCGCGSSFSAWGDSSFEPTGAARPRSFFTPDRSRQARADPWRQSRPGGSPRGPPRL